jgi:hypothetical protein
VSLFDLAAAAQSRDSVYAEYLSGFLVPSFFNKTGQIKHMADVSWFPQANTKTAYSLISRLILKRIRSFCFSKNPVINRSNAGQQGCPRYR